MFKMFKNKKMIAIFVVFVLIVAMYMCYPNKKEYFVVKVKGSRGVGEVLLDHADFAEIMNGLKPTSIAGTFTKDDLSELIREFKRNGMDKFIEQYDRNCGPDGGTDPILCRNANILMNLVNESESVTHPVTNQVIGTKDEWIRSIVDLVAELTSQNMRAREHQQATDA
tara:strand:- start:1900 stop:2403 length:504 start_codon:yes stop_codon:yes gene_type:complete